MAKTATRYLSLLLIGILLTASTYFTLIKRTPTAPLVITPAIIVEDVVVPEEKATEEPNTKESSPEVIVVTEKEKEDEEDTQELVVSQEIPSTTRHIFFDLNNVLFEVSTKQAFSEIGAMDIAAYKLGGNNTQDLENKLFEILGHLEPATAEHTQQAAELPQQNAKPFPPILCRWLRGEITGQALLDKALTFIQNPAHSSYFSSKREKRLLESVLRMMVDADVRSKLYIPLKKGIALMQECKNFGHKVYLVANADHNLITLMQQKYPDIFSKLDGTIVSSQVGLLKPSRAFFDTILKKYKLSPEQCYFIDGSEETVKCVQSKSIPAIHYTSDKHATVIQELKEKQILTSPNA